MTRRTMIVSFSFEQEPGALQLLQEAGVDCQVIPHGRCAGWKEEDFAACWAAMSPQPTGLLMGADFHVGRTFLRAASGLKYLSLNCAGTDHLDMEALACHGVQVRSVPRQNYDAVADLVFGQILCLMRKICQADRTIRAGGWNSGVERGRAVSGKTLGVIGTGAIGQAVMERAVGFHMPLIALSRSRSEELTRRYGVRYLDREAFFRQADIVVLACPLAENTRHIIDAQALALMGPDSILINPSRGGLVDDAALLAALRSGGIAGAALDAFCEEPLLDSPYFALDNVLPVLCKASHNTGKAAERLGGGDRLAWQACDVSGEDSVQALFDGIMARFGRLDGFVSNAGIYPHGHICDMDAAAWDRVFAINTRSVFLCARQARRCMPRGGSLVQTCSFAAISPSVGSGAYAASKAAVYSMTKTLAAELAPRDIRVNGLIPGVIDTDITRPLLEKNHRAMTDAIALHRAGMPEDVAHAAIYLLSDESAYLTGSFIEISGGKLCVQNPADAWSGKEGQD